MAILAGKRWALGLARAAALAVAISLPASWRELFFPPAHALPGR